MKAYRLKTILLLLLFSLSLFTGGKIHCQEDASWEKLPNIIIMTFSGVRNSESIEDPAHQYIPHLWKEIFKEGTLYTNLLGVNHEFHMPAMHAIFTGMTYPECLYPLKAPTIFHYLSNKYSLPQEKLWSLGTWSDSDYGVVADPRSQHELCALSLLSRYASPQLEEMFTKPEALFWGAYPDSLERSPEFWPDWDSLGQVQQRFFWRVLKKYRPKFIHYALNDVETAHSDTFSRYVLALKNCDERISRIKQFIDSDPYYKGRTYLIINVDHTRDSYYRDHFENAYPNPSRVWMYIYGPGVKKGAVIKRPVYHTDIFATVAYLMDVETHVNDGRVLKDCFQAKK